jgi:TRAP-type mannitol/chloroaromatic compound transport system permease small subunit
MLNTSLPSWFIGIRKIIDWLTNFLNVIGTLLIVALIILVNADVIGRVFFSAPVSGVPELVSMSIVAIVFLQVAQAFRMKRLTRTEVVIDFIQRRAPKVRHLLELVFSLAAIGLVWQLYWASQPLFLKAWKRGTYEGTVGDFTAPIWPVKFIILIGCLALLIQLTMHAATSGFHLFSRTGSRK